MPQITIPYNWEPRDYQLPFWRYMNAGGTRAILVWHRRAGKDLTAFNYTIAAMLKRPGLYWHLFPTYKQGRKAIWNGFTSDGRRFIDYFPKEIVRKKREDEMRIELVNGAIWQVVGTDDVDNLVGSNPVGLVFSEYPLQNQTAWELLSPILAENGGWAVFPYTPRGRNHGYELWNRAQASEKWFTQMLTAEDTKKRQGVGSAIVPVINPEQIQEERDRGMPEEMVRQEYYCSFDAPLVGSYFADQMAKVEVDKRLLTRMPIEEILPVHTAWDLGLSDHTAIWFFQLHRAEIRIIKYVEKANRSLAEWIKYVQNLPYKYGNHLAPHDIKVRDFTTGQSRWEFAKAHGIKFTVVPKMRKADAINAGRSILPQCYFHYGECFDGVECLKQYRKKYDSRKKIYLNQPEHDKFSHGADAFQTLAVGLKGIRGRVDGAAVKQPVSSYVDYDPVDPVPPQFGQTKDYTKESDYDIYNPW